MVHHNNMTSEVWARLWGFHYGKRVSKEEITMQKKWTIEIIADHRDKGKNEAIDRLVKRTAANMQAAVLLVADSIDPQVAAYSDDFFVGRQDFDILVQEVEPAQEAAQHGKGDDAPMSDSLMEALGKS